MVSPISTCIENEGRIKGGIQPISTRPPLDLSTRALGPASLHSSNGHNEICILRAPFLICCYKQLRFYCLLFFYSWACQHFKRQPSYVTPPVILGPRPSTPLARALPNVYMHHRLLHKIWQNRHPPPLCIVEFTLSFHLSRLKATLRWVQLYFLDTVMNISVQTAWVDRTLWPEW